MLMEILSTVGTVLGTILPYASALALLGIMGASAYNAIKYTASKTKNYDESKNKAGHCW